MINSATQPTAPRTRRGRPRRTDPVGPGLPEIIEAVVALADNEDCTEIAMRDVAAALQVSPKLLYRHVSGKSEMLDLAASAIVEKWEFPASDMPWCDRLAAFIHETQHLLRRYPALAEAALLRTLKSDGEQQPGRVVAAVTECFCAAGLSRAEAERTFTLCALLALGELTLNKAVQAGALPAESTPSTAAVETGMDAALSWLIAGIRASRASGQNPAS